MQDTAGKEKKVVKSKLCDWLVLDRYKNNVDSGSTLHCIKLNESLVRTIHVIKNNNVITFQLTVMSMLSR